jgi:glutamate synthase (NADPH/NADH) small chain
MKADRSVEQVEWLLKIAGIEIRHGVEVGRDISLADLERDFDAVFPSVGLGPDNHLGLLGEDLQGVVGAVDFIERFKLENLDLRDIEKAVVIGGGNTPLDVVRELLGLGLA